jgi:hypothetical protein
MKKEGIVLIVTIAMFTCLLLCTLTSADYNFDGWPVETRTNGTLNGTVFFDSEPWGGTKSLTLNSDVPDGTVKWARLYTGIWGGNPESTYWHNVTFNGIEFGPIHLQGESDINPNVWVSGSGKHWWWYDVTDLTNAGETNTAHTWYINGTDQDDGRVYGIVLVVVLENESVPTIQYWVNDGSDALHYGPWPHPARDSGITYFNGTENKDMVSNANLTVVHLTAYEPNCANCLKFNEHELDTSMVDSNDFELNSWDVTSYIASSGNNAWYSRGEDGFVSITNAILVMERKAVEVPIFDTGSPANPYSSIFGTHNGTITPNYDITVSRMYTYPCTGTGGHSEYAAFYNATTGEEIANGTWDGYQGAGNYHYIIFEKSFIIEKDVTYNYTIRTGSYPQIIHKREFNATGGKITCEEFIDANRKVYYDWIPAFRLE